MSNTALGYSRLSQQSDTSIERQERNIRDYADENGFRLASPIYSDGQGASGWETDERPEYQQLKDELSSGAVDAVIVNDKRRLTRDVDEAMRLIPEFRENGVELHTCQDGPLDLSDPIRAAIEIVSAAAAHEEKMEEIEKAREATQERVDDPEIDHGRPRFGMEYNEDGTRQVPGDRYGDVLEIFRMDSRGATLEEIAEEVDVAVSTVSRVLKRREWYVRRDKEQEGSTA